ncbi:MAG TPA: ABC transporter ATP-binding protein [Armatimonadota bacterium]
MIQLRGVSKSYGDKVAVSGLDLEVRDGEIFGFLGPNGAGKTTTIKMISGLLRPDKGTALVNGIDVRQEPLRAKRCMAYVPDNPDVYEKLTGYQFINFIADAYGVPPEERRRRCADLARTFELEDALGDLIESYSHGMRQKVVLISALVHAPRIWVLDEPLVGLDPRAAFVLKGMMREHADAGNTVFFSTHVLEVAERLCDRVGVIVKGQLVACGTLDQLRSESGESLESVFLELVNGEAPRGGSDVSVVSG